MLLCGRRGDRETSSASIWFSFQLAAVVSGDGRLSLVLLEILIFLVVKLVFCALGPNHRSASLRYATR